MAGRKDLVFAYTKVPQVDGSTVNVPLIEIELQKFINGKEYTFRTKALLDTGSMFNLFPAEVAAQLGITKIENKDFIEMSGIAADNAGTKPQVVKCWGHKVGIKVGDKVRETKIYFADHLSPVAHPMLGGFGFFDKFQAVKFDYKRGKITIKI